MRNIKVLSLFIVVFIIIGLNASCKKNKVSTVVPVNETNQSEDIKKDETDIKKATESSEALLTPDQFPSFQIIKTKEGLRKDDGQTLFVLVPAVNLELRNHVTQTKNLIKRLIVLEKRPENISILIFDDPQALEKVFDNPQTEDLNVPVHYLARYDGNPANTTYQNTLIIFPIAPDSNPAVKAQNDTIDFNPFEW